MKIQQTPPVDPPELVTNSFPFSVLFVCCCFYLHVCLFVFIMFNQLFLLFLFEAYIYLMFRHKLRLLACERRRISGCRFAGYKASGSHSMNEKSDSGFDQPPLFCYKRPSLRRGEGGFRFQDHISN